MYNTKIKIEKIANEIKMDSISFEDAIKKYSEDESKVNGGLLISPNMSTMNSFDDMNASLRVLVENLSEGEVSNPVVMKLIDETNAYRILKINKKVEAHIANLVDDFTTLKELALISKQNIVRGKWINKASKATYIKINEGIIKCEFKNKWIH
jgi:peptidyl-prolyl cis-trans isomerase SurA